jgi:predicted metal-binding protein
MSRPVVARPRRASPILVCKKCLKRVSDGKEIRRELKHVLKEQREGTLKRPRVVSTSCFGICPKRAVVLASAKSLQNGEYVLVSHRRDVEEALKEFLQPA